MCWIKCALIKVKDRKFHIPAGPVHESQIWHKGRMLCGRTVTPLNYYETEADANAYCGGRLSQLKCKQCARAIVP